MAATRMSRNMNDGKPLQRSGSKADAIRRGTLRISGPIPVLSDLEDELPPTDRSAVSSRVHEAVTEKRSQLLRDATAEQSTVSDAASQNEHLQDGQAYSLSTGHNSVRVSPKSDAKTEPSRKVKGGSLRAAVRRLFGRKSKPTQLSPVRHRHGYHRSDPSGLVRSTPNQDQSSTPHRSFSMPMRDITPSVALQSHSPAVQFPHSKELKPLDLRPTIKQRSPHRRATLGNSDALPKSFDDPFWDSIVPIEDPNIGLAVTSDNSKRRSRSADALRAMSRAQAENPTRRRSDEIRYWRASVERPMSGESRHSGTIVGAIGPERKVNSTHFRDSSDEPLSPRHGRIFDFGSPNDDKSEKIRSQSPSNGVVDENTIGLPISNELVEQSSTHLSQEGQVFSPADQTNHQGQEADTSARAASGPTSVHRSSEPGTPSQGQFQQPGPTSEANTYTQTERHESEMRKGGYLPESDHLPTANEVDPPGTSRVPQMKRKNTAESYSDDYINLIGGSVQPEPPTPLSPNTSITFEAVSNVIAYERAARKHLETIVYDLRRQVAELRSIVESKPDRLGNDEMDTYRSRSSETMDAAKTLERLEGYSDNRVTVIQSRFSGFDSIDDSNGGTNEEDEVTEGNDGHVQPASSGQEDQTREQSHHSPTHSTDLESQAFETPTEEASGYAYYDDDDSSVAGDSQKPLPPPGTRIPVAVGGMF